MPDIYQEIKDWSLGVISANEPDIIPLNAVPRAHNTAFRNVGQKQAVLGTRPGLVVLNDTAFTGSPVVHRLAPYAYDDGTARIHYLAAWGNNGTLRFKNENDTFTSALAVPANFPFSTTTCFTSGDYIVDATVMNNRLFAVNTNGERRSLLNQTYKAFGLSPVASVAVTAQSGGSSSMPLEAYDVSVTSYDSATGAESSRNASVTVTTAGANDRIRVVITPTAGESAQYTHWRVYLRRQTTQARLYKVLLFENVGGTGIVTDGDIPIATTTVYIDLTAAQIANLIVQAPNETENNGPVTSVRFLASYGRRLIAADRNSVYWSKIDRPDNFPPENEEPIETGEGDEITGIFKFSDEILLVLTSSATWGIFGNDPQTWVVRPIDTTIGCASHLSLAAFNGGVGWWDDHLGPVFYDGGRIQAIGLEKLGSTALVDDVEQTRLSFIAAGVDPVDSRVVWSYPSNGTTTRNDAAIPYNFQMSAWEASVWDGLDIASLATGYDEDSAQRLFVGGYAGQVFKFDRAIKNDGIPSGTTTGTFVAAAETTSTITGTGFYNTASGLVERKVTVLDEATQRPLSRHRITTNNGTTLTLSPAIDGLSIGTTYRYEIGGPDFRVYTKWLDADQPFLHKRFDRVYLQAKAPAGSVSLLISTHIDFDDADQSADTVDIAGDAWDEGIWDTAIWSGGTVIKRRLSVFKVAHAMRIAILHFKADVDIVLQKVSLLGRVLSDRELL